MVQTDRRLQVLSTDVSHFSSFSNIQPSLNTFHTKQGFLKLHGRLNKYLIKEQRKVSEIKGMLP